MSPCFAEIRDAPAEKSAPPAAGWAFAMSGVARHVHRPAQQPSRPG